MSYNIGKSYSKIILAIESSENKLHLRTCSAMIGQFNLMEDSSIPEKDKQKLELNLKNKLDERAFRLGLF